MATITQKIEKIIRDFNDTWDLNIVISRIILKRNGIAEYQPYNNKGWIYINQNQDFKEIKEDVLHELGHALIHQKNIHHSRLRFFHHSSLKNTLSYIEKMNGEDGKEPPYGFVSWYATFNGTEDFCETLSAYVSNNYSFKKMRYNDQSIPVADEPKLQKKLLAIFHLLESLSENARAAG